MRARPLPLLLLGIAVATLSGDNATRADSWMAYGRRIVTDVAGRTYVVLTGEQSGFRGARFAFVEAKAGSPRVGSSESVSHSAPEGSGIRDGDTVLAEGRLDSAPLLVRVSARGTGFAAMATHGSVGSGTAFVWVTRDGEARHLKRMHDLFTPKQVGGFTHTASSIWWYRDAWINEQRREVVVVGAGDGGLLKIVSLTDGSVRPGDEMEIRRAIRSIDPATQTVALDLAHERRLRGLGDAMRAVLEDNSAALGVRLRAAVLLAHDGDRSGATLLRTVVEDGRAKTLPKTDFQYAVAHLGEVLGAPALPLLRELMRGPAGDAWNSAQAAFVTLGEAAVPTLVAMLEASDESTVYRGGAAHALRQIGAKTAVSALLTAVADTEAYVANAALNAVIETSGAEVSKELAALLDRKTTQDGRLATYFEEIKEATSIAPLIRCLARHPHEPYPRDVVLDALRFQTNVNLGYSVAAWERWLKQHR